MASSSPTLPAELPLLVIGMVIAPQNQPKMQLVRDTMLRSNTVTSGQTVFRFLIGCPAGENCDDGLALPPVAPDVLRLSALDGAEVSAHGPHCACTEKTSEWLRYAVETWPGAAFFGKTEDDAYVHLDGLAAELVLLHEASLPHVRVLSPLPPRGEPHAGCAAGELLSRAVRFFVHRCDKP